MERYFKTQEGKLVNIIEHTLEQIEKWKHIKIYVGTDSQFDKGKIEYVTCICYRYGKRGVHFIYLQEKLVGQHDMSQFTRLFEEGMRTVNTADHLTSNIPVAIDGLEFDYAGLLKTLSTKLVGCFKGYPNARFKPDDLMACRAADHILRHSELY